MPPASAAKRAKANQVKNLERALKEERNGLVAIARAVLEESPDPERLIKRLELMVRQAEQKRQPERTRDVLMFGYAVLIRAREQLLGQPQTLFEPHVGHIAPGTTKKLANTDGYQQVALGSTEEDPLGDVKLISTARADAERHARDGILVCLKEGPMTDVELRAAYEKLYGPITAPLLLRYRVALKARGRIVKHDEQEGKARWRLLEQQ